MGRKSLYGPQVRFDGRESRNIDPIEIILEYRNASGHVTLRKVRVMRYLSRRNGRSYLSGVCSGGQRSFRVDRIVSVAKLDGEVVEKADFLASVLDVPNRIYG